MINSDGIKQCIFFCQSRFKRRNRESALNMLKSKDDKLSSIINSWLKYKTNFKISILVTLRNTTEFSYIIQDSTISENSRKVTGPFPWQKNISDINIHNKHVLRPLETVTEIYYISVCVSYYYIRNHLPTQLLLIASIGTRKKW